MNPGGALGRIRLEAGAGGRPDQIRDDRLRAGADRDAVAHLRDLVALARDLAGTARDAAFSQLDAAAEQQAREHAETGFELVVRAEQDRRQGAAYRAQVTRYRQLAAADREAAARDRDAAAQDRKGAEQERDRVMADHEALAAELIGRADDDLGAGASVVHLARDSEHGVP